MREIKTENSSIYIPEIIIGLKSDSAKVKKAYQKVKPDIVAIQTSEEELEALKNMVEGEEFDYFLSNYEEIYAKRLAVFGEVKVPPPCYETALELCQDNDTPIFAIDMDDVYYTDVFCESISGWDLVRHSLRFNKLKSKTFKSETAEDFVMEWDREINKLKGFRHLEAKREEHMAKELLHLTKKHERILCIMDIPRTEGVSSRITLGSDEEKVEKK
jgi:pheromone shutdown protein TraB